jgi:diamine N-acetyltransferase
MEVVIREASPADYEAVCALFVQLDQLHAQALPDLFQPVAGLARPREFFAQMLADEEDAVFVAVHQGALVGLLRCSERCAPNLPLFVPRRFVSIDDLVVAAAFQGTGIGRLLMERAHQWARDRGASEVELVVWEFNASARAFYERQGYQTVRRVMRTRLA